MDDEEARYQRAVAWYRGEIEVGGMQVRLEGDDVPHKMHTLVCLFGNEEIVPIIDMRVRGKKALGTSEVCRRVRGYTLPPEKIKLQYRLWAQYGIRRFPPSIMWEGAVSAAAAENLPVGFIAFGEGVLDDAPIALLQIMMTAPLEIVLDRFKTLVPPV
jgi:hypothetical protein